MLVTSWVHTTVRQSVAYCRPTGGQKKKSWRSWLASSCWSRSKRQLPKLLPRKPRSCGRRPRSSHPSSYNHLQCSRVKKCALTAPLNQAQSAISLIHLLQMQSTQWLPALSVSIVLTNVYCLSVLSLHTMCLYCTVRVPTYRS